MFAPAKILRVFAAFCLASGSVRALVVDNTTTLNDTPPSNGAPWFNVGKGGGASAVYLKKGWVVSARHVFGGATSAQVNFAGTTYSSGTVFVLKNPDNTDSDVVLFNIGAAAPAQSAEIGLMTTSPLVNTSLTMIGHGSRRSGGLMSISHTNGSSNGYYSDYLYGANKSWGSNRVASASAAIAGTNFWGFHTSFTATGSSGTAQATVGDSGGGLFYKPSRNSAWQLAATMNAVATFNGQPGGTALNGNRTFNADMFHYAEQINARLNATSTAPALAAVSPGTLIAADQPQTLTFTGSNVSKGAVIQRATSDDFLSFSDTAARGNWVDPNTMTLSVTAQSPATWKFRVVNPDGQPSAPVTVTITPQTSSTSRTGPTAPTGAEATADTDNDGLNNLQEYALGSDPSDANSANHPVADTETAEGQSYLTLTYDRDTTKSDITYQVQTTSDLTTGEWSDVPDAVVSANGTIERRKARVAIEGTRRFLRLQISP